jgi:hypothetical protein
MVESVGGGRGRGQESALQYLPEGSDKNKHKIGSHRRTFLPLIPFTLSPWYISTKIRTLHKINWLKGVGLAIIL